MGDVKDISKIKPEVKGEMNIINKNVDKLTFYEKNNKKHPAEQVTKIAKSIKEFGFKQPILIDKDNNIIAGHGRVLACKELGIIEVPTIICDDLSPEQIRAFRIADNKVAESEWDIESLNFEFDRILEDGGDLTELSGFSKDEITAISEEVNPKEVEEDNFEIPAEPKYKIEQGEIWQLGDHRLFCGDSTNKEHVDALMGSQKADMVFTDPPYGVNYTEKSDRLGKKEYNEIKGDSNIEEAQIVWKDAFQNIYDSLRDGGSYYITAPQGGDQMMMMMMMKGNIKCKHELIWVKPSPVFSMGRLDYDYQHEPILYGWKGSHKFLGKGKFTKSIWEIGREKESKLHPTMKPIELIENMIKNSSKSNDTIIDFFGGSGSTLIACEQLGRKCYMMELDPIYCSVIIERWEKLTGKKSIKE